MFVMKKSAKTINFETTFTSIKARKKNFKNKHTKTKEKNNG